MNKKNIETIAIQAGREVDSKVGAVMTPIHLSTTYVRGNDQDFTYSRTGNPNRQALERCLMELEGGANAIAFGSGMAAVAGVFQSLGHGDHIILPDDTYFAVRTLVSSILARWGLQHTLVDMTDLEAVKAAIKSNTRLIWIETPSNPMLKITDIGAVAEIAKNADMIVGVDATWATPILQSTLRLGADIVVHSTTKYLGGHSDLTGGAVIVSREDGFYEKMREIQGVGGGVPSGFDCWLLLRGIRTLTHRMRGHCENTKKVVQFLTAHPNVTRVHYPGLENHPGYDIAKKQMQDFGGMLSIQVKGGFEKADAIVNQTRIFARATSLGGVESLIEHRAPAEDANTQTPIDLIRISVGLENADDLIKDLEQALK